MKWCEHSERNALYNACRSGTALENAIAVVTFFPCADCARGLIQSGIKTIVTTQPDLSNPRWGDDFKISMEMFKEVGINMILLDTHEVT
jgi:dCMP deaminase